MFRLAKEEKDFLEVRSVDGRTDFLITNMTNEKLMSLLQKIISKFREGRFGKGVFYSELDRHTFELLDASLFPYLLKVFLALKVINPLRSHKDDWNELPIVLMENQDGKEIHECLLGYDKEAEAFKFYTRRNKGSNYVNFKIDDLNKSFCNLIEIARSLTKEYHIARGLDPRIMFSDSPFDKSEDFWRYTESTSPARKQVAGCELCYPELARRERALALFAEARKSPACSKSGTEAEALRLSDKCELIGLQNTGYREYNGNTVVIRKLPTADDMRYTVIIEHNEKKWSMKILGINLQLTVRADVDAGMEGFDYRRSICLR